MRRQRTLTKDEVRAYRQLARAAARLRKAQEDAKRQGPNVEGDGRQEGQDAGADNG